MNQSVGGLIGGVSATLPVNGIPSSSSFNSNTTPLLSNNSSHNSFPSHTSLSNNHSTTLNHSAHNISNSSLRTTGLNSPALATSSVTYHAPIKVKVTVTWVLNKDELILDISETLPTVIKEVCMLLNIQGRPEDLVFRVGESDELINEEVFCLYKPFPMIP